MVELKPNSAVCHCISVNLSKAKATCIYHVLLCPVTKLNITNIYLRQYTVYIWYVKLTIVKMCYEVTIHLVDPLTSNYNECLEFLV